jgi:hypothetical protein
MTIYSLYIYDRHTECVYVRISACRPHQHRRADAQSRLQYHDWHRTRAPRPPADGNFRPGVARYAAGASALSAATSKLNAGGKVVAVGVNEGQRTSGVPAQDRGLPFDEEAKLVYGVVLSLRNMVKKLSGRWACDQLNTSTSRQHPL